MAVEKRNRTCVGATRLKRRVRRPHGTASWCWSTCGTTTAAARGLWAETYPDGALQSYVENHFIPVRFNVLERPEAEDRFNSGWTPTIIVEDAWGREHRRSQGYLGPERFIGELALARLKDAIDRRDFETALECSRSTLKETEGDPARRSEALYWSAVASYRVSGNRDDLIEGWNRLLEESPRSEWAERAGYIRKQ